MLAVVSNEDKKFGSRRQEWVAIVAISGAILFAARQISTTCAGYTEQSFAKSAQGKHAVATSGKYDLALKESYGFFDDIENSQWLVKRDIALKTPWYRYPHQPELGVHSINIYMMDNFHPMFTCPYTQRIGGMPDGGKWVCDPIRLRKSKDCVVYSVGSNGQHEFEDEIFDIVGSKNCEIHTFDPNPTYERPNDVENKNRHYHAWGIKSSYTQSSEFGGYEFKDFREIAKILGHEDRRIEVFKIDCEGCEWTAYKDILAAYKNIGQLQIEIHPFMERPGDIGLSDLFQALREYGFVPFSKEANTWVDGSGVYEFSFIRLNLNGNVTDV